MPARKVHSRWDLVWMLDRTIKREKPVRFVGRLGRKRPLWERWLRGKRVLPVLGIVAIQILGATLLSAERKMPPAELSGATVMGIILYLACMAGILRVFSAQDDVRCIISARERARFAVNPDRRMTMEELFKRRRKWEAWIEESSILKPMLVLQSAWFRASVVAFVASAAGLQLWRDHAQLTSLRATAENAFLLFYAGGFLSMVAFGIWTWRRIKRTLEESLRGEACPDCGYRIVVSESGHPGTEIAIGPSRCSECGCPWPLIPPQAANRA